jgi:hypothetical protein
MNLARVMKIVALLLFLLPWVTVSCSAEGLGPSSSGASMTGAPTTQLVRATGLELASGDVVFQGGAPPPSAANAPPRPFSGPDMTLIGAAFLIALAFAATFLEGAAGVLAAIGCVVLAGAGLCYTILVRVPQSVRDYFGSAATSDTGNPSPIDPAELARMIQTKVEAGFWLTIAALVATIVFLLLAMPRRNAATLAPASE